MDEFTKVIPVRVIVAILIFFGSFVSYMLRVHISVVLLHIAEISNYSIKNDASCGKNESHLTYRNFERMSDIQNVTTEWKPLNPIMVATLLSTYNVGYSFSILLSEPFAEKIGVVRIVGYNTLLAAILTILCPLAFEAGVYVLVAVRFLIGFSSGFLFPLLHILIVKWSPMNERNIFSLSLYGTTIGIIATYPISGYIMKYSSWKWVTYVLGTAAIFWAIIWLYFVTDLPKHHGHISTHELDVIDFRRISLVTRRRRKRVPWLKIIKCKPIWALFILLWGNTWNLSFYIDYMPLYYYSVLDYDIGMASTLSGLPVLARMLCSWACLPLVQCFVQRKCFSSIGKIRKFFSLFSHILPAIIQLSLLYVMLCNRILSTIVPIVVLGLSGTIIGGGLLNTVDLTPHFAANVYNAMQAFLCFAGISMPYAVAVIVVTYHNRMKGWIILLGINSGVYLIGGIVFLVFGSGKIQEWDVDNVMEAVSHSYIATPDEGYED